MDLKNLEKISEKIEQYNCALLAVVKNQKISDIKQLVDFGISNLGENRVDELSNHKKEFPNENYHFIAPLQSRKIPEIIDTCKVLHSVHRTKELDLISQSSSNVSYFVQVNIDNDPKKSGINEKNIFDFVNYAKNVNHFPSGIMCIPNIESDRKKVFSKMQKINKQIKNEFPQYGGGLSMGMSDDYEIALDYGATIVRIGSKIFS